MANQLHTFLSAGFNQSAPVIGEAFTYNAVSYLGVFTQVDEKLLMEIVGYIDEADAICVTDVNQYAPGAAPQVTGMLTRYGGTYVIRGVKQDASAYVLILKKISV